MERPADLELGRLATPEEDEEYDELEEEEKKVDQKGEDEEEKTEEKVTKEEKKPVVGEVVEEALALVSLNDLPEEEGLFVVQPPAKQWENLAACLDWCLVLADVGVFPLA